MTKPTKWHVGQANSTDSDQTCHFVGFVMRRHILCFHGEICLLSLNYHQIPTLSVPLVSVPYQTAHCIILVYFSTNVRSVLKYVCMTIYLKMKIVILFNFNPLQNTISSFEPNVSGLSLLAFNATSRCQYSDIMIYRSTCTGAHGHTFLW